MVSRATTVLRNTCRMIQNLWKREPARDFLLTANDFRHHSRAEDNPAITPLTNAHDGENGARCETLAQTHEVLNTMLKAMISASGWQTHGGQVRSDVAELEVIPVAAPSMD